MIAHVDRLAWRAFQVAAIAVQCFRVGLAVSDIVGADHAARSRLDVQPFEQRFSQVARLVGGNTPGNTAAFQFIQQAGYSGVGAGHATKDILVQFKQAQALTLEGWILFLHVQAQADQRPCAIGYRGADPLRIHGLAAVFGAQGLHHRDELVGGVHQCAVQVENHSPQIFGYFVHTGFTARTM